MKKSALLFVFILICSSCQKEDFNIINLNNNQISALGHGGMGIGQAYPMNSFESILNCLSLGADGTELDVQMTKDSVLVAFHDEYLQNSTHSSGQIFTKTWEEIKNTSYSNTPYTSYKLIRLDMLFENIPNPREYEFFFDCKSFNLDSSASYVNTYTNALLSIIERYDLEDQVYLELKRRDIIQAIKNKAPEINIFVYLDFEPSFELINELGLQGITIAVDNITKNQVQQAHDNGTMVAVFNTNSKSKNIDAIEKNVDFIQSDRVKHLIRLLK